MFLPSQETAAKICGKSCSDLPETFPKVPWHSVTSMELVGQLNSLTQSMAWLGLIAIAGPWRKWSEIVRGSLHDIWHSPAPNDKHRSKSSWARGVRHQSKVWPTGFGWDLGLEQARIYSAKPSEGWMLKFKPAHGVQWVSDANISFSTARGSLRISIFGSVMT